MRVWNPKILIGVFLFLLISNPCEALETRAIVRVKARTADGATREIGLYSGYYALVAGCGDYRKGWPRLPNPVKDAREVTAMLRKIGWKVDLLEDPDWASLRRALNRVIIGPGREKDKAVLFWFSGHGHTLKEVGSKKLGYIVPVDAPNPDRDELGFMEHAISMRQIETIAKRIQSRHVIMLFDSCFSGAIFQAVRSKPTPHIEEKVKKSVRQFVTAGTEDEQVPDQSVFKTVFLQAIKDGFVHGTMLQNPYGQGYIGSYAADRLRSGCTVKADAPFKSNALTDKFIDSGTVFAGVDDVDNYVSSMQAITKELFGTFEATYLDC